MARGDGGTRAAIPAVAGIGLRAPHIDEVLATRSALGWVEVHPENYMGGGPGLACLEAVRRDHPVSLHGVGLSLGSPEGIDDRHLRRLAALAERIEPGLVSEHLSWSVAGGVYLNDLLPLPYTEEALAAVCRNVERAQDVLDRAILLENPSSYLRYRHSLIPEPEFLAEVARRTGCDILCDVNNIHVTCTNFGLDARAYIDALPKAAVREIHLAGHFRREDGGRALLIDDHAAPVAPAVWDLYGYAVERFGRVPTLVEWDKEIPTLAVLLREARTADEIASARLREEAHAELV